MKKFFAFCLPLALIFAVISHASDPHIPKAPIIVASQTFTLSANLPNTAVFTPSVAGQYRVQVYLEASPSQNIQVGIGWTDDFSTNSMPAFASTTNYNAPSAVANRIWPLYSVAGQPITLNTQLAGPATYTLFVVVEQLE